MISSRSLADVRERLSRAVDTFQGLLNTNGFREKVNELDKLWKTISPSLKMQNLLGLH